MVDFISQKSGVADAFPSNRELGQNLFQRLSQNQLTDTLVVFFSNGSFDGVIQDFVEQAKSSLYLSWWMFGRFVELYCTQQLVWVTSDMQRRQHPLSAWYAPSCCFLIPIFVSELGRFSYLVLWFPFFRRSIFTGEGVRSLISLIHLRCGPERVVEFISDQGTQLYSSGKIEADKLWFLRKIIFSS